MTHDRDPTSQAIPDAAEFPWRHVTRTAAGTRALGSRIARLLRGGETILLHGPLGAGKTCLVQGIATELGVTDEVVSPTFTLVNRYEGELSLCHLDFYRVEADASLADIGVEEILDEIDAGEAVLLVEWPAPLLKGARLPRRIEMLALPGSAPDERIWHWRGIPDLPAEWRALVPE